MFILKGEYVGANEPYKRGDYTVREIGIKEEKRLVPIIVSVSDKFINKYKIGDKVELPVYIASWDSVSKKYNSRGLKISALAEPKQ